jgi:hypothetical protein
MVKNVMLANDEVKEIIEKVAELMRVLITTKGAAHLGNVTDLKAVKKNDKDGLPHLTFQPDIFACCHL